MSQKQQDPLIGKTLEKCRLLEKLGTGGMGSVYLAEHFGLGRKVAVKILPPDMSRDPEYVARFMREATTAGRLEHPNIVQVHDVGYAEQRHFIVMQYVEGESLSTAVEALGALEPRDAARIVAGVLRGLHHAHEHGVVHRDVKPDNILLAKGDEPKLLDFGLAIETEGALQLTKDGLVVGTPYYLSPEQARGQRATPISDIYAAGVLLYYLVTGKRPFVGATALAVLNKHIREKPVPPMSHNPKIPRPLNDIILKMMAKRPEDRYPTAAAAADDLDNFLADRPVTARITEPPRWLTPHIRIAGAAAGGFLVLVLAVAIAARSCGGPPPVVHVPPDKPGPATPAEPAPIGNLDDIIRHDLEKRRSPSEWAGIIREYTAFIESNRGTRHAEIAARRLSEFRHEIESHAQELISALPPPSDKLRRMEALNAIPEAVLEHTSAGQFVPAERARLAGELHKHFREQAARLDSCLEEGDFELAERLINDMRRYADQSQKQWLLSIEVDLPERRRRFNDPALRRLGRAYERVREQFEAAMIQRRTEEAYGTLVRFLAERQGAGEQNLTRVKGVNYDGLLMKIALDSTLDPDRLDVARLAVEQGWARSEEGLAREILSDIQDALDMAWLIRMAGKALRALSTPDGEEINLATYGGRGRVVMSFSGYVFRAAGGAESPLSVAGLLPADLVLLAARAGGQDVDEAAHSNPSLARAAGVCYMYSRIPERWPGAARWFARAAELNAPGPPGRAETVRQLGRRRIRASLTLAQKDVTERRYDAAKKTLAALEEQAGDDRELLAEIGTVAAAILSAEIREAWDGRGYGRVKELYRLLRDRYAGLYDEEPVRSMYCRALWGLKDWLRQPLEPSEGFWDWDGKEQGAPPPAAFEGHDGLRIIPGKRIFVNPARARGISGMSVQIRINAEATNWSAGFHVNMDRISGNYGAIVLTPTLVASGEGSETGLRLQHTARLDKKPAPNEWIDLAFVAEAGDVAVFLDRQPLLSFRYNLSEKGAVAIAADVDASFRKVDIRK